MNAKIISPAKAIVAAGIGAFSIFAILNQSAKAAGQDTARSGNIARISDIKENGEKEMPSAKKTPEQALLLGKLDSLKADYTERVCKRGADGKPLVDKDGKPVMPYSARHYRYRPENLLPDAGIDGNLPGGFNAVKKEDGTVQVWAGQYQYYFSSFGEVYLMIIRGQNAEAGKAMEFLESYIRTLRQ